MPQQSVEWATGRCARYRFDEETGEHVFELKVRGARAWAELKRWSE